MSGSKRNVERIRKEAGLIQERFENESTYTYDQQHTHMNQKLEERKIKLDQKKKKMQRERLHSHDSQDTQDTQEVGQDTQQETYSSDEDFADDLHRDVVAQQTGHVIRPPPQSTDPFRGMEEAIAEEKRLGHINSNGDVIQQLDVRRSSEEDTTSDSDSD